MEGMKKSKIRDFRTQTMPKHAGIMVCANFVVSLILLGMDQWVAGLMAPFIMSWAWAARSFKRIVVTDIDVSISHVLNPFKRDLTASLQSLEGVEVRIGGDVSEVSFLIGTKRYVLTEVVRARTLGEVLVKRRNFLKGRRERQLRLGANDSA